MGEENKNSRWNARKTSAVVGMGLLTAIVAVLQVFAAGIKLGPFSITLSLAPIIVGAALYGWKAGAWLGFVFSVLVLFTPDVAPFMAVSIPAATATVILKGTAAGACAGLAYAFIEKKDRLAAVIAAGATAPIVNTGVFLLGCAIFFFDLINEWAEGGNVFVYLIFVMTGLNFLVELGINLVLSSAIVTMIGLAKKKLE